jgi:hypothetical protein
LDDHFLSSLFDAGTVASIAQILSNCQHRAFPVVEVTQSGDVFKVQPCFNLRLKLKFKFKFKFNLKSIRNAARCKMDRRID